ncbi:MAG TPA: UvrD-helicase domain-containing protein, partial [Candidatus Binataceae bacterium]|nr:UvrD-helicase domain-containing protein [Candidatus Binataceae bacterium]
MNRVELSDEQRAAIFAPGNLAVRAGAGSGKTEVLARRFDALVAGDIAGIEPLSPELIAAITFTEKATYDMKRRIAQVLLAELAIADGERAARLDRARRLLPLARISTIHAFCARILRENPLEARIDPDFDVLDEDQSRTLLESNVEELLIAALRSANPGALHLAGARGLRGGVYREGAIDIVVRVVTELHRLGKDAGWLRRSTAESAQTLRAQGTALSDRTRQLVELIEELRRTDLKPTSQAARDMGEFESEWPRFRSALESFSASSTRSDLNTLRELCEALPDARGRGQIKARLEGIRLLLKKDGNRLGLKGEVIEAYGAQRAIQPTLDTCALIANIFEQIERGKQREGVATFDDLLGHTFRLLRDHDPIAYRYRKNLRAILVDEYQDVDPMQDAIVRLLCAPRDEMPAPQYFIVGDEKQSIYRFRGADVTVFGNALEAAPSKFPLSQSRRSVPSLLSFINALSARAMRSDSQPAGAFWVEWNEQHRLREVRAELNDAEPSVEIILCASADESSEQAIGLKRRDEARAIANRCREMLDGGVQVSDASGGLRPLSARDIALLLRSFEDVQIYERALGDAGIPCYTVKGRGFFGCREILDIAELLAAINDPNDSLALAAALRSPFFTISDQCLMEIALRARQHGLSLAEQFASEQANFDWLANGRDVALHARGILVELRSMRESAPLTTLIEHALALTDFEAVMIAQARGTQRVANVRKLVEIARDFESRSFFSLADFIGHLRRLTIDQPREAQAQIVGEDEDVMRLMTIHQAKGLEFPIVVLADIGRGTPPQERNYLVSAKEGLLLCDTVGSGHDELPHPLIESHRRLLAEQEKAESARLLYVAITRARDRLIVSEGPGIKGWHKPLRDFLGPAAGAFLGSVEDRRTVEIDGTRLVLHRCPHASTEISSTSAAASPPTSDEIEFLASQARERLGFVPIANHELTVSPTALADFERCPRQYWFRNEVGLPENKGLWAEG